MGNVKLLFVCLLLVIVCNAQTIPNQSSSPQKNTSTSLRELLIQDPVIVPDQVKILLLNNLGEFNEIIKIRKKNYDKSITRIRDSYRQDQVLNSFIERLLKHQIGEITFEELLKNEVEKELERPVEQIRFVNVGQLIEIYFDIVYKPLLDENYDFDQSGVIEPRRPPSGYDHLMNGIMRLPFVKRVTFLSKEEIEEVLKYPQLQSQIVCPSIDIVFVVDESGSIHSNRNEVHKTFWSNIVSLVKYLAFQSESAKNRIGFVEFASSISSFGLVDLVPWEQTNPQPLWTGLAEMIKTTPRLGEYTNLTEAIKEAKALFDNNESVTNNKVLVIISDGYTSVSSEAEQSFAIEMKNEGIEILTLSPQKQANIGHLEKLSSSNQVYITDYQSLAEDIISLLPGCG